MRHCGVSSMRTMRHVASVPDMAGPGDDYILLKKIIIPHRSPQASARMAREMLARFGTTGRVLQASDTEFRGITGYGPDISEAFSTSRAIARAVSQVAISGRPLLDNIEAVFTYCRAWLAGERREQFHVLHLDKSYRLIAHDCLQIGTVDHVTVYPREVMHRAISHCASAIVLVHNHPSGNSQPSGGDIAMTNRLVMIGHHMGIAIADHIIVGEMHTFSFARNGLLKEPV